MRRALDMDTFSIAYLSVASSSRICLNSRVQMLVNPVNADSCISASNASTPPYDTNSSAIS